MILWAPKTSHCPQARFADAPEEWRDGERYATAREAILWNEHLIRSRDDIIATRVIASDLYQMPASTQIRNAGANNPHSPVDRDNE